MSIPSYGEPWTVERDHAGFDRIFRPDTRVCIALMTQENVRAMACVNALAGLEPAALHDALARARIVIENASLENLESLRSALRKLHGETP